MVAQKLRVNSNKKAEQCIDLQPMIHGADLNSFRRQSCKSKQINRERDVHKSAQNCVGPYDIHRLTHKSVAVRLTG